MEINELNERIKKCKRCRLAETKTHSICGEGNLNAKLMLIAQAPGQNENKKGKMFIGPSGRVLNELLNSAGINRQEIYITNLIKCMLPKYRKPKEDEIKACAAFIDEEIELINPKVLIPLGYYAGKYIFKKYSITMLPKHEFHTVYGRLFWSGLRKIFPLPHPAALLYNPSFKKETAKNYAKMNVLLEDCKWYPVCPIKRFYEDGVLDRRWVELYCKGDWESCIRYQMEEKHKPHSDFMLPDGSISEGLYK